MKGLQRYLDNFYALFLRLVYIHRSKPKHDLKPCLLFSLFLQELLLCITKNNKHSIGSVFREKIKTFLENQICIVDEYFPLNIVFVFYSTNEIKNQPDIDLFDNDDIINKIMII